jgi:carbamate kinase
MSKGLVVVALGGHSLVEKEHPHHPVLELAEAGAPSEHVAGLISRGTPVVVVHGNGPQVGLSLLRSEIAADEVEPTPLAECVAETQGTIGLGITTALEDALIRNGLARRVVPIVTRVVVEEDDPAFLDPTKPIGPVLSDDDARRHEDEDGWEIKLDKGRGLRRVVASPGPKDIVELEAIKALTEAGFIVVAAGGGGIPVVREGPMYRPVAAVIDKDRSAALLAHRLEADGLAILTSVEGVMRSFGTPEQELLRDVSLSEARALLDGDELGEGSMRPKVQAAVAFLEHGGKWVVITTAPLLDRALAGEAGTRIVADPA